MALPFLLQGLEIRQGCPQSQRHPWCAHQAKFPGVGSVPGEGQVPKPGLFWEHYMAALAPANTTINGVECETRADMVFNGFWVISLSQ